MSDAKQIADNVIQLNKKLTDEQTAPYRDLAAALNDIQLGDDITKPILALLALEDDAFRDISPMLLMDINKSFHDSNNQLMMLNTFNANGITLESFHDQIDEFLKAVDDTEFTQPKKDFLKQIFMDMYNAIAEIKGIPKHIVEVPIEVCHENAKIPCYANPTDSGMDIYALEDITIKPGETKLIPTGLKVAIPVGYELQVRPKSGRALKTKLRVANTPGTIDAGYRDEVGVIIDNIEPPIRDVSWDADTGKLSIQYGGSFTIGKGEKFAQLVLCEVKHCSFQQIDNVSKIENDGRMGGYGSTGLK